MDSASTPEEEPGRRGGAAAPARMTTVSRHYFGGASSERDHDLRVDIVENIEEDYGMFVWPCSVILAEYVWQQRPRFSGSKVVELGAGTSLPGLVAAKVGADVTLTDIAHNTEVLNNIRQICGLNNANCTVLGLTWGDWDEPIFDLHPDIILGADVLYDSASKLLIYSVPFVFLSFWLTHCIYFGKILTISLRRLPFSWKILLGQSSLLHTTIAVVII